MREAQLQRAIQRQLRHDKGWFVVKMHGGPFSVPGIPDLLCFKLEEDWPDYGFDETRYVWLEVKMPGEGLTKTQEKMFPIMRGFGAEIHVVRSVNEALEALGEEPNGREVSP